MPLITCIKGLHQASYLHLLCVSVMLAPFFAVAASLSSHAQIEVSPQNITNTNTSEDFNTFSSFGLSELMEMDVQATSAMKRSASFFETPASLYVLSSEQIRHSGANSIPEALKLVPGLTVRKLDNNQWAISARGIASRLNSKLLVMIDGQNIYTPRFASVLWETINVPLYDIERIEVIRGQGGQLWGSNAISGVINIITKQTLDSRGFYGDASIGSQVNGLVNLRYGAQIGNRASYRLYGRFIDGTASSKGTKLDPADTTEQYSIGGRFDFIPNDHWSGFIQGDITHSELGQNFKAVIDESNKNVSFAGYFDRRDTRIQARIENRINSQAQQMLQFGWIEQSGNQGIVQEHLQMLDIDYQINMQFTIWHWDVGLHISDIHNEIKKNSFITSDTDDLKELSQYGGYLQAQWDVIPDELSLSLGNRIEHNDFTGWENQPIARMTWQFVPRQLIWASVSKGVRFPSLLEYNDNYSVNGFNITDFFSEVKDIPVLGSYAVKTFLDGNNQVDAEESLSYELGYRLAQDKWSLDISAHYTDSSHVMAIEINPYLSQFYPIGAMLQSGQYEQAYQALLQTYIALPFRSVGDLHSQGVDANWQWQATSSLIVELGYSYHDFDYHLPENHIAAIAQDSTQRQIFSKLDWHIFNDHQLIVTTHTQNSTAYQTDSYTTVDAAWRWQFLPNWSLMIAGKNLFAGSHLEYSNTDETYTIPNYIDESVEFRLTASF